MTEPSIVLTLPAAQVNAILTALNEAPYRIAAPIIASIFEQANANPAEQATPPRAKRNKSPGAP